MSADQSAYRRILTSTSLIGGATVLTILIGIVRTKLLAVTLGAEGIGAIGLLANVSNLAASVAGLGLAFAAVRELAAAPTSERKAEIRRALLLASVPLGLAGALALWLFREPVALLASGRSELALLIGLSGLAVLFVVLSAAQQSVLQGLQRIKALASSRVASALLATLIAVPTAYLVGGPISLLVAVVIVPLASVLVGLAFAPRDLPPALSRRVGAVTSEWRALSRIGALITLTTSVQLLTIAAARSLVLRDGGLEAAGLFQAVITVSSMNITLVLGAMAADYFPRLTTQLGDPVAFNRTVNQQLHSAVLLALPLLIAMFAAAPLVLTLLYSNAFADAETLLRWQLVGDILKMPAWALGFVLLAHGSRGAYLLVELLFNAAFIAVAFLLLPRFGLGGVGVAYFVAYGLYSALLLGICKARHGVTIDRENLGLIALAVGLLLLLHLVASMSEWLVLGAGGLLAGGFAIFALRELGGRAGIRLRPRLK